MAPIFSIKTLLHNSYEWSSFSQSKHDFKSLKGDTVHALKDITFTLKKGELLTVLGPSGCGKTTLLNIAAGFLRPTSGSIALDGNEIKGPGVERGMVFQQGALFEWLTVVENVNFGLRMKKEDSIKTAKKSWRVARDRRIKRIWKYSNLPIIWGDAAKSCSC